MMAFLLVCVMLFSSLAPPLSYASDFGDEITESAEAAEVVEVDDAAEEVEGDFTEEAEETTEAEKEDVAGTETEDTTITTQSMGSEVGISSDKGIELTYSADGVTVFNRDALKDGEVWADKSIEKTSATDSSFNETLSIYGKRFTYESTYETGNYVLVVDTTRSLYLADTSGSFIQSITAATNAMVADICKNPLSNVSVIGFSCDHSDRNKYTQRNKNTYATTVLLGMGNWSKVANPLTCSVSASSELDWYIGATTAATNSKIASTGKRYISYGTYTQAGIAHAANILDQQTDKSSRAAYMILITDGVPTMGTTSWTSAYTTSGSTSSNVWRSEHANIVGEAMGAVPEAAAFVPMTAGYWKVHLAKSYKRVGFYSILLSNDDYDSSDEALAKWCCGVRNANSNTGANGTYAITSTSTTKTNGYYGTLTTGWSPNRVNSGYTGSKTADLKAAAARTKKSLETYKDSLKLYNWQRVGAQSATQFDTPILAQFAAISNVSSAANKTKMLQYAYANLKLQLTAATYNTTAPPLKDGTNVTFSTTTEKGMVVSTAPKISFRGVTYDPASTSGTTYTFNSTYTYNGTSTPVTGTVSVKAGTKNNSVVTVTLPASLVNAAAMANSAYPTKVSFGVDLYTTDHRAVCDKYGETVVTYTNDYTASKTTAAYTTSSDNPFYASVGTATVKKSKNATGTLDYVSGTAKGRSGSTSTDKVITIFGLPAGQYRVVADSVPEGYVMPKPLTIEVKDTTQLQHYDLYVPTIIIDIWAVDKQTGEKVKGVKVNILDKTGKPVGENIPLEYVEEYFHAGDYVIHTVTVPDEYELPADVTMKVKAIREKQDFIIPLIKKGSITVKKLDADGVTPLSGVTFELTDSTGKLKVTKTTGADGTLLFDSKDGVSTGTYTLTETKTTAGHSLLSEPVTIQIPMVMTAEEVKAQKVDTSKGSFNADENRWYFYDVTYEITNHSNFVLPMTGGSPVLIYGITFTGILALAGAAYVLLTRRRGY